MHYFPILLLYLAVLSLLLILPPVLVEVGVLHYTYRRRATQNRTRITPARPGGDARGDR